MVIVIILWSKLRNHFHYFAGIIQQAMGYSVELTCHVEAYPKPTINWVHEGIQLSTNQVSIISEFLIVCLIIYYYLDIFIQLRLWSWDYKIRQIFALK